MPWRNDKCPCGSGKKYKKCCLIKQREHDILLLKVARSQKMMNSVCPECNSGKLWKDCCFSKHLAAAPIAKPEGRLERVVAPRNRPSVEAVELPQARVV